MGSPTPLDGSPGPTLHLTWAELTTSSDPDRARLQLERLQRQSDLWAPLVRVAEVVEVLRVALGLPVRVTSGLRIGDGDSQHDHGQALDIQVDGRSPLFVAGVLHGLSLAGALPHPLRQVISETTRDLSGLAAPMARGGGGWVHVAVVGAAGERFADAAGAPLLRSWLEGGSRVYRA